MDTNKRGQRRHRASGMKGCGLQSGTDFFYFRIFPGAHFIHKLNEPFYFLFYLTHCCDWPDDFELELGGFWARICIENNLYSGMGKEIPLIDSRGI